MYEGWADKYNLDMTEGRADKNNHDMTNTKGSKKKPVGQKGQKGRLRASTIFIWGTRGRRRAAGVLDI